MHDAIVILPTGFEEIEAITCIDLLRRAQLSVTVAALGYPLQVTGRSRIDILAEGALDEYSRNQYRAVILPGGPGYTQYLSSPVLEAFLKAQTGYLAAICAAPVALGQLGYLAGRRYTCHTSVRDQLPAALPDPVVVDGRIVTSSGAGTSYAFALRLVELLADAPTATEVAHSTCYV